MRRLDGHRDLSGGRRTWRDVGVLVAGQGATQLLNLAALAVVARTLGAADFGLVQVAVVMSAYAMVAAEAGLFTVGVRDLARLDDLTARRRLVANRSGLLLVLALVAMVMFAPLTRLLSLCAEDPILFLIYLGAVMPQAFMLDWAALGLGSALGAGLARVVRAAVYLLIVAAWWATSAGLWDQPARRWLGIVFLISLSAGNLVAWAVVRRRLGGGLRPVFEGGRSWLATLKTSSPVGTANVVRRVLYGTDILMLGILGSAAVAGRYAAAAKLGFVLVVGVEVALGALLPRLSRAWSQGSQEFALVLRRQLIVLVAVLAIAGSAGALLGPTVIGWVFGAAFAGSTSVLPLLMIAYPLLGIGLYLHEAQIAAHRQQGALIPLGAAAVAAVIGSFVMIPQRGAVGAAQAMILAHGLYALGGALRCRSLWRP